ncbi:MAG: hypothetical protein C5B50_22650 [Verrucomicrobia bacterium]|nr:MAG: hypothetical protein C5B50_22650 [Verrucomicrobiota bacterium]
MEEILNRVIESGVERAAAIQLVALLPLAYGRVSLSGSGAVFCERYVALDAQGKPGQSGSLASLPFWLQALDFAKQDREPSFPIMSRSAEVRAANAALLDGKKLGDLVWSAPVFVRPIDFSANPGNLQPKARWWRQIWDAPAEHSVTHRESTIARGAMIVALLVGLFAIGALMYYVVALLR